MKPIDAINTQLNAEALGQWQVLKHIQYKDWQLYVHGHERIGWSLCWKFWAECTSTGEERWWFSRDYPIHRDMTVGELVQTAFMAALQAEEHECRENFKYQGIAPFNPHIAFSAIMAAAHHIEGRPT